jgi:pSer/pThr/pTyr-binding forkhead associated (FHA) protein
VLKLTIVLEGEKNTTFDSDAEDLFIGRIPTINDLCISNPSVSRQHAHIKRKGEKYMIFDLKSLNGIYLNGSRISEAPLEEGDEILLGEAKIGVTFGEGLTSPQKPKKTKGGYDPSQDEITQIVRKPKKKS